MPKLTGAGIALLSCLMAANASPALAEAPFVKFQQDSGALRIDIDEKPFCKFVYKDNQILRPYFCDVHAPNGVQVTRNHPPFSGQDKEDHATMHPGIWLAFGDMSGTDFWRNKGRVQFEELIQKPKEDRGSGTFAFKSSYISDERAICTEVCQISIKVVRQGILLTFDSKFTPVDKPVLFGDQEEMGLGVRIASGLIPENGGQIQNSSGEIGEAQAWGKQAKWCRVGGRIDGEHLGIVVMPHPENFRPSWFHARDYGLLVANPFGQNAFTGGQKSVLRVEPSEQMRLRFGVLVYSLKSGSDLDVDGVYREYVGQEDVE